MTTNLGNRLSASEIPSAVSFVFEREPSKGEQMVSRPITAGWRAPLNRTGATLAAVAAVSVLVAACSSGATKLSTSSHNTAGPPEASNAPIVLVANNSKYGKILTNAAGFALYVYTADLPGGRGCDPGCLKIWPPLLLPAGVSTPVGAPGVTGLGTFPRGDRLEVTYNGLPLYTYITDTKPGEVTGQDVVDSSGKWILATVPPANISAAAAQPLNTAPSTTHPPATQPPATQPPVTQAPSAQPPATQPPVTPAPATPPTTAPGLPTY